MQWTTRDAGSPEARFSTNAKALARKAMGTSKTYGIKDLCGVPATTDGWVDPGHLHEALMTGLKPNTRYYYKYGQVRQCAYSSTSGIFAYKYGDFLLSHNHTFLPLL